jgi:hypothetical protein
MGTWAVQATATHVAATRWSQALADQGRASGARFRGRVAAMVNQMLGDDEDELTPGAAASTVDTLDTVGGRELDDSYPYYLSRDRLEIEEESAPADPDPDPAASPTDSAEDSPTEESPEAGAAPKQRHTPRHAAPSAPFTVKLSGAKLPGFAPRSSHAGW